MSYSLWAFNICSVLQFSEFALIFHTCYIYQVVQSCVDETIYSIIIHVVNPNSPPNDGKMVSSKRFQKYYKHSLSETTKDIKIQFPLIESQRYSISENLWFSTTSDRENAYNIKANSQQSIKSVRLTNFLWSLGCREVTWRTWNILERFMFWWKRTILHVLMIYHPYSDPWSIWIFLFYYMWERYICSYEQCPLFLIINGPRSSVNEADPWSNNYFIRVVDHDQR